MSFKYQNVYYYYYGFRLFGFALTVFMCLLFAWIILELCSDFDWIPPVEGLGHIRKVHSLCFTATLCPWKHITLTSLKKDGTFQPLMSISVSMATWHFLFLVKLDVSSHFPKYLEQLYKSLWVLSNPLKQSGLFMILYK